MNNTWTIIALVWFLVTGILTTWVGWTWEDGGFGPPGCLQCGLGFLNPIELIVAGIGTVVLAGAGLARQFAAPRAVA